MKLRNKLHHNAAQFTCCKALVDATSLGTYTILWCSWWWWWSSQHLFLFVCQTICWLSFRVCLFPHAPFTLTSGWTFPEYFEHPWALPGNYIGQKHGSSQRNKFMKKGNIIIFRLLQKPLSLVVTISLLSWFQIGPA